MELLHEEHLVVQFDRTCETNQATLLVPCNNSKQVVENFILSNIVMIFGNKKKKEIIYLLKLVVR